MNDFSNWGLSAGGFLQPGNRIGFGTMTHRSPWSEVQLAEISPFDFENPGAADYAMNMSSDEYKQRITKFGTELDKLCLKMGVRIRGKRLKIVYVKPSEADQTAAKAFSTNSNTFCSLGTAPQSCYLPANSNLFGFSSSKY